MNIIVAAGGTGGHIIPALTIADELKKKGHTISWLGLKTGLESKLVPAAGYKIDFLPGFTGLRGKSLKSLVLAPFKVLRAVLSSIRHLRKVKPSGVILMGGYIAGPVGLAAFLLRIPMVIHEQNSIAGTTNKILSKLSDNVLSAYKNSFDERTKFLHVGNPVRRELLSLEKYSVNNSFPKEINLLVIGGSLGARDVNNVIAELMTDSSINYKINLIHQTGIKDFKSIEEKYNILNKDELNITVTPYIDDMDSKYNWADVVVSRAGAMSIAEILACSLPSILVPFPYATDNHQYFNAKELAEAKSAILIEQKEFTVAKIKEVINEMLMTRGALEEMSSNASKLFNDDVNSKIASYCVNKFA